MEDVMKYLAILFSLAVILFSSITNAYAIDWRFDFASALKEAKTNSIPVMVDFYTGWCGWCKKLDSDTYSDQKVNALAKEFICVKLDAEKNRDIALKYNIRGYPTILFFDSNGAEQHRIIGYVDAPKFIQIMTNVMQKVGKPSPAVPSLPEKQKKLYSNLAG